GGAVEVGGGLTEHAAVQPDRHLAGVSARIRRSGTIVARSGRRASSVIWSVGRGQAEEMAGRVGEHDPLVAARLELGPGRAALDQLLGGPFDVGDLEVEV